MKGKNYSVTANYPSLTERSLKSSAYDSNSILPGHSPDYSGSFNNLKRSSVMIHDQFPTSTSIPTCNQFLIWASDVVGILRECVPPGQLRTGIKRRYEYPMMGYRELCVMVVVAIGYLRL